MLYKWVGLYGLTALPRNEVGGARVCDRGKFVGNRAGMIVFAPCILIGQFRCLSLAVQRVACVRRPVNTVVRMGIYSLCPEVLLRLGH